MSIKNTNSFIFLINIYIYNNMKTFTENHKKLYNSLYNNLIENKVYEKLDIYIYIN